MRIIMIYRDSSDHGREVREFLREYQRRTGHQIEVIDPDSKSGIDLAQAYDLVEYPSMLALTNEGRVRAAWRGRPLPTINEVSFYA